MGKRPVSVMVYSGILIFNSILRFCALLLLVTAQHVADAQDSLEEVHQITTADYVVGSLDAAVFLICGVSLFLRQGWSRFLLMGWVAFTLLYELLNQELTVYSTARSLVFIGIMAVFMFSEKVSAWFSGKDAASPTSD